MAKIKRKNDTFTSAKSSGFSPLGLGMTVLFFVLTVITFASLWTYSLEDHQWLSLAGASLQNVHFQNKCGGFGARIGFELFSNIGLAAYLLTLFFLVWGFFLFYGYAFRRAFWRMTFQVVAIICVAAVLSLLDWHLMKRFLGENITTRSFATLKLFDGGNLGNDFAQFATERFGQWGSLLFLSGIILAVLVTTTGWDIWKTLMFFARGGQRVFSGLFRLMGSWKHKAHLASLEHDAEKLKKRQEETALEKIKEQERAKIRALQEKERQEREADIQVAIETARKEKEALEAKLKTEQDAAEQLKKDREYQELEAKARREAEEDERRRQEEERKRTEKQTRETEMAEQKRKLEEEKRHQEEEERKRREEARRLAIERARQEHEAKEAQKQAQQQAIAAATAPATEKAPQSVSIPGALHAEKAPEAARKEAHPKQVSKLLDPDLLKDLGEDRPYKLPPLELLSIVEKIEKTQEEIATLEQAQSRAALLEETLKQFGIDVKVVAMDRGPRITCYELELAPGIKTSKILGYSDDVARALKAVSVRIIAPIPGKSTIGVEVPNASKETVYLREVIETPDGKKRLENGLLPLFFGKDVSGNPVISDLTKMPHLLIAGATGTGKSVCINTVIISLLMSKSPDDLKLILIDPKMVEMTGYKNIPHLISPVVTDMKKAAGVLEWACGKMDARYEILEKVGVRHVRDYNRLTEEQIREHLVHEGYSGDLDKVEYHLPYIVIVVDEFADLMMTAGKEVEQSVTRLAQKSRAVGIHVLLATQRPSVDVITGLIKSNMPSRISFKTSSKVDSRTILDQNGAEALLGMGDMLFIPPNTATPLRAQCSYLEDDDINRVVEYVRAQRQPSYYQEIAGKSVKLPGIEEGENPEADPEDEAMYKDAVRVILENQRGSVSLLQRKMGLGYNKASRLVEMMEERGVVGPQRGSKPREVLFTLEEWDAMQDGVFAVSPAASTATEASEEDNYPDETGEESSELEASSNNETDDDEIGHEEEEPEVAKTGEPGGRNRAAD